MADATVIGADISRLVQNSPNHKLPGSALAVLLKRGYPDFRPEDFGCRNLRDFIRTYAKEVFEDGKNGGDIRYSVALLPTLGEASSRQQEFRAISSAPVVPRRLTVDTPVWKTFVSPTAPYRIYGNRETGEFRVVHSQVPAPGGAWIQVPPCPPETHVQIAKEFVEGLADESAKNQLTKILGLDSWWNHFFFSARNFGVERQWSAFRRRRLHAELEQALHSAGVPLPFSNPPSPVTRSVSDSTPPEKETQTDSQVRRIAAAVIRRLSDSELREVWLPLGHVLDVLGEK
jgi:hypothetical protein